MLLLCCYYAALTVCWEYRKITITYLIYEYTIIGYVSPYLIDYCAHTHIENYKTVEINYVMAQSTSVDIKILYSSAGTLISQKRLILYMRILYTVSIDMLLLLYNNVYEYNIVMHKC